MMPVHSEVHPVRRSVPSTFGLTNKVFLWLTLNWLASLFQGILIVLPAKGLEMALAGYTQGTLTSSEILIFFGLTLAGPLTLFLFQIISAKTNIIYSRSIFYSALKCLSAPCSERPDPDIFQSRLMNDGAALVEVWRSLPSTILASLAAFISAFFVLDQMTVAAVVIIGSSALLSVASSKLLAKRSALAWRKNMDSLAQFSKLLRQRFVPDFADVLEAANTTDWANDYIGKSANKYFDASMKQTILSSTAIFVPTLINSLSPAFILLWYFLFSTGTDVAATVGVMTFASLVVRPLVGLGDCFEIVTKAQLAKQSLGSFLDTRKPLVGDSILNQHAPESQPIKIVGASGVGKTTFLKSYILCSNEFKKKRIGYSPQNPTFMDGSLLENISMGREIPSGQITRILNDLGLLDEFRDRGGLQAIVDGNCTDISGGQARRLALARAIVDSPDVVALDEPLNGLDKENMQKVKNIMSTLKQPQHLVEINHLGTIINGDYRIINLRNSRDAII